MVPGSTRTGRTFARGRRPQETVVLRSGRRQAGPERLHAQPQGRAAGADHHHRAGRGLWRGTGADVPVRVDVRSRGQRARQRQGAGTAQYHRRRRRLYGERHLGRGAGAFPHLGRRSLPLPGRGRQGQCQPGLLRAAEPATRLPAAGLFPGAAVAGPGCRYALVHRAALRVFRFSNKLQIRQCRRAGQRGARPAHRQGRAGD
ncbi:hypothetical protein D9M68_631760 [compost metagenome]